MNDEHDADPDEVAADPELGAAEDAQIRALLAELGSGPDGEPMPPEVAARLDETLALLVAERGRTGGARSQDEGNESASGTVVPLRRRWLNRATVAAAAVIVLGAGSLAVANFSNLSQPEQQSSADSAGRSEAKTAPETGPESAGESPDSRTGATLLPDLSAASFESDVAVLLQGRASMLAPEGEAADEPSPNNRDSVKPGAPGVVPSRACPGPKVTDGAVARQVLYDSRQAVLLVHPERAGRLLVEAWNCTGDRRLASTKITP